jgi:hypothetical protein
MVTAMETAMETAIVEARDSIRIADLTLEIEIFIRIMSRSSLLSCAKISMERWGHGQDEWW